MNTQLTHLYSFTFTFSFFRFISFSVNTGGIDTNTTTAKGNGGESKDPHNSNPRKGFTALYFGKRTNEYATKKRRTDATRP